MCTDLGILHILMPGKPINVYNNNNACVCWSKSTTTKRLRHITIRENAVQESVDEKIIQVLHVSGETNLADMFTKEMKDTSQFISLRDLIVRDPPCVQLRSSNGTPSSLQSGEGGISNHS